MKKTFTKEHYLEWFKKPEVDPQSKRKLKLDAKNPNSIANQLKKQCDKYKDTKVKQKSLSPVLSISKSITKKQTITQQILKSIPKSRKLQFSPGCLPEHAQSE